MEGLGVPSEKDIQRIGQLRPRTVLYFFSGGTPRLGCPSTSSHPLSPIWQTRLSQ